jgi:hypothetical protein
MRKYEIFSSRRISDFRNYSKILTAAAKLQNSGAFRKTFPYSVRRQVPQNKYSASSTRKYTEKAAPVVSYGHRFRGRMR